MGNEPNTHTEELSILKAKAAEAVGCSPEYNPVSKQARLRVPLSHPCERFQESLGDAGWPPSLCVLTEHGAIFDIQKPTGSFIVFLDIFSYFFYPYLNGHCS